VKQARQAIIIVDLGFGDAGKGLLTDYLVRRCAAHTVVRFNGGAQAGHNVVTSDRRHHTFSQIGSGAFVPGTRTFLTRDFVVHPTAMLVEGKHLESAGVHAPLASIAISERARVVTPFQQAMGRLRELARGTHGHGTCGVGVGEVRRDEIAGMVLSVNDLLAPAVLRRKLGDIQEMKRAEAAAVADRASGELADQEREVLSSARVADAWCSRISEWCQRVDVVPDEHLRGVLDRDGAVVFEGAQGVLLDENRGFHPYTTWSDCTPRGALALLREHAYGGEATRLGVARAVPVRHGRGPFPTEDFALSEKLRERHNSDIGWQGRVRRGWPDRLLSAYAARASGPLDAIAVTHVDQTGLLGRFQFADRYTGIPEGSSLFVMDGAAATAIATEDAIDLERQASLGEALEGATPGYLPLEPGELPDALGSWFGAPVRYVSRGPTATDVEELLGG
jgi:adenylosuccinate synthase